MRLQRHNLWVLVIAVGICAGMATAQAASESDVIEQAQQRLEAGQPQEALDTLQVFLQAHPDSPLRRDALLRRGMCEMQLNQSAAARATFELLEQELATAPDAAPTLRDACALYLAELSYRDGLYASAIRSYQRVISSPHASTYKPMAQLGLGWAYYQQGQCAESFAAFDALRQGSDAALVRGSTLYALAECARRLGRPRDAMTAFDTLIRQDPANEWTDEAALALSELLTAAGQATEARALCERMLQAQPASPMAPGWHVHAGHLALKARDIPAAQAHFQAVATSGAGSPYYVSALVGLGDAAFESGAFQDAARHYERALLYAPRGPYAGYARFQQAQALVSAGQWARARQLYEQLVAEAPTSRFVEESLFRIGETWAAEGNPARAIEYYAQVVNQYPHSVWAMRAQLAWGDRLAAEGRWQAAEAMYTDVVARNPLPEIAAAAQIRHAKALAARGERLPAATMMEDIREHATQPAVRVEAGLVLARWAAEALDWPRAEAIVAELLPQAGETSWDAEVQFWRGWVAFHREHWGEAITAWEELAQRYPGHVLTAESRPWHVLAVIRAETPAAGLALLGAWQQQLAPAELEGVGREVAARLREEGLAAQAIPVYTFLIAQLPETLRPEWWVALGETHEELHDTAKATAMYRRAAEAHPAEPWASRGALAAARLLESEERWNEARQLYQQVSETASPEAIVARERLERLQAIH